MICIGATALEFLNRVSCVRVAPGVPFFDNSDSEQEQDGLYFWINKLPAQYEIRKGLKVDKDTPYLQITLPQ